LPGMARATGPAARRGGENGSHGHHHEARRPRRGGHTGGGRARWHRGRARTLRPGSAIGSTSHRPAAG
jgi:hypothetical protein